MLRVYGHGNKVETTTVYKDDDLEMVVNGALDQADLNKDDDHGKTVETTIMFKDEDLEEIVNGALAQADINEDGFIDYYEYKSVT
ncbi:unnamed protein product, partial [Iphiclides podalirius]